MDAFNQYTISFLIASDVMIFVNIINSEMLWLNAITPTVAGGCEQGNLCKTNECKSDDIIVHLY